MGKIPVTVSQDRFVPIEEPCRRMDGRFRSLRKNEKQMQEQRMKEPKHRCDYVNLKNPLYIQYHDEEWGVPEHADKKLYEMLILECFQAGLSWECILNKRENFRHAFAGFDVDKVCGYDEQQGDYPQPPENIGSYPEQQGIQGNTRGVWHL